MSNKLISDLGSAVVLVTDLIEHQPIAGPPSKKGTVTALFSDVDGQVAIDRDNRILKDSANNDSFGWETRQGFDSSGTTTVDWEQRLLLPPGGGDSVDWGNRILYPSSGDVSVNWEDRQLIASDGTTAIMDWSSQQPSSGPQTAGAIYTATEQTMIQEMYDALRAYGLLS